MTTNDDHASGDSDGAGPQQPAGGTADTADTAAGQTRPYAVDQTRPYAASGASVPPSVPPSQVTPPGQTVPLGQAAGSGQTSSPYASVVPPTPGARDGGYGSSGYGGSGYDSSGYRGPEAATASSYPERSASAQPPSAQPPSGRAAYGASVPAGAAGSGAPGSAYSVPGAGHPYAPSAGSTSALPPVASGSAASGAPSVASGSLGGSVPAPSGASAASAAPDSASGSRRRGPGWGALVGATLLAILLGAGGGFAANGLLGADRDSGSASASSTTPAAIATGDKTQVVESQGDTPDWENVVAAVSNSVVSITFQGGSSSEGGGVGSGVVYDSSGHILTNNHVVATAKQLTVTLADGRMYEADITGTDPATDLAVIELKDPPDDLTVARFGDSDSLVAGQDVMAIGTPLNLSSTATTGIISALDRPVVNEVEDDSQGSGSASSSSAVYTNAIQIDAAINPGNSGGPLFDEHGYVIGITSSIASLAENPGNIGIGFAIPSNLAKKVADQLIDTGSATHAYLGVSLDEGLADMGSETRAGAEVTSVESGSPAAQAGLQEGDIITAIDGRSTAQAAALTGFVRQYSAGETVTLTVVRDGKQTDVKATLAERPDS